MNLTQAFSYLPAAAGLPPSAKAALQTPVSRLLTRPVVRKEDINELAREYGNQLAARVTRPDLAHPIFDQFTRAIDVGEVQSTDEARPQLSFKPYPEARWAWIDFADRSIEHAVNILATKNLSARARPQPLDPAFN